MTSSAALAAFDIHEESDKLRETLRTQFIGAIVPDGPPARRGWRPACVTIDHTNWDTHDNNFPRP